MFNLGFQELLVILILALIIFGPGKLPEVGRAIGKSLHEFKKASREVEDEVTGSRKAEGEQQQGQGKEQ
jgi:sec-independent protein translocase protein TatA